MKPILFKSDMVRAILEGRKTETRRIFKKQPTGLFQRIAHTLGYPASLGWLRAGFGEKEDPNFYKCPYGRVGDRLWVRETVCIAPRNWAPPDQCISDDDGYYHFVKYRATDPDEDVMRDYKLKWTPSIFMPRWASRIILEITEISVERVKDITDTGCVNEGLIQDWDGSHHWYQFPEGHKEFNSASQNPKYAFRLLWDSINEKRGYSWQSNPWGWVIKFKLIEVKS